jgi:ribosomal protein S18 acetylase RimI-like enzyme
MITCTRADSTAAEVISLAVDPKSRGKGAASALMASSLRRVRRRGISRTGLIVKVTNHPARRFYEKWEFTKVRRIKGYYEDGTDGIRMVRATLLPAKTRR